MTSDEEMRLTRLVADQGSQIALLTQNARVHKLVLEQIKYDLKQEREAVVAWLRERAARCREWDGRELAVSATYRLAAAAIERGEHRRKEEG